MKKSALIFLLGMLAGAAVTAQPLTPGIWKFSLKRMDGNLIVFTAEVQNQGGKPLLTIMNGSERLTVPDITVKGDSIRIVMPVFESRFEGRIKDNSHLAGSWIKGSANNDIVIPFEAEAQQPVRFASDQGRARFDISGRWAVKFFSGRSVKPAVAEFKQIGNHLNGTFLTPTGDDRYLEGIVTGDSLKLSTFDGGHAYLFTARITSDTTIAGGMHFASAAGRERWSAVKDANASYSDTLAASYVRPGQDRLHFAFPDLDGKKVSIRDSRFRDKVVIIQIMGSWCPNCMDETAFLSEYYNANKKRGVEVIALAYEYSTDFQRSQKNLRKFQQRFQVHYPMLITGVKVGDSLRTEKTLPEITPIRSFPTTILIGRDGKIKKIDAGFMGPGTGEHYEAYRKKFMDTVDRLLRKEPLEG